MAQFGTVQPVEQYTEVCRWMVTAVGYGNILTTYHQDQGGADGEYENYANNLTQILVCHLLSL